MTDENQGNIEVSGQGGGGGRSRPQKTKVVQNVTVVSEQRTPVELANNLFSTAFAKTVYGLCEGEVEGFPDKLDKDIFLDGVPLESTNGVKNFEGYSVQFKSGTNQQEPINGFNQSENVRDVSVQVEQATPVVRAITDTDVERCRVIIAHPALLAQDAETGDINGTSVRYRIQVSVNGGVYTTVVDKTVSGKSNSEFQRAYEFDLAGSGPWQIRVQRITADSSSALIANDIVWQSFVEIIDEKLAYPNTAVLGIKVDARQFSTIPDVSARLRGKRVQIPSNYDPIQRTYSGIWDGTFVTAWTDNPAWIFRDICLNERYGVRRYVANLEVDKWALYSISQYCDERVPDGKGAFEPRFTCNVYLQNPGSVYQVLNSLASCFRGLIYYSEGKLYVTQDRNQTPVQQFSEANVIQDVDDSGRVVRPCFSYAGSARAARKTVCIASWDDPSQNYLSVAEYQQDDELLERFGYNPVDLRLLGVTSRGQALRAAKHTLFSNRYETDKVSFRIGAEGLAAGVGEIIQISDPVRQGQRLGGRIREISGNFVTTDAVLTLSPSITYTLSVVNPNGERIINGDGTSTFKPKLQVLNVVSSTNIGSESIYTRLELNGLPDSQVGSLWVLEWSELQAATYRIVSVAEVEPLVYQVEAIQYNDSKYGYIDNDLPIAVPKDRFEVRAAQPPTNLSAKLKYSNNQTSISASWRTPQNNGAIDLLVRGYRYQWRKVGDANWSELITIQDTNLDVPLQSHVFGNNYQFKVSTVDRLGRQSEFVEYDVDAFDPIPDISDPAFGATIRHQNQPDGTQLLAVDPGTCPIPERVNGYRCWVKPRTLSSGEIPGVKPPNEDGWYFLADIPLTGYYTVAFHAPDTYDVRANFTSAIFGETPTDYIYDFVERDEIAPPTPSNFGVVENQDSSGKRFSWQLPLSEYGSWDQSVVADVVGYEVRYKKGTLSLNNVGFNVSSDLVFVNTSTVIGTRVNQHLFAVGDEIQFAASAGTLPTGITAGTTYYVVSNGFTSTAFKISATSGGAPINLTGTATGTYNVSGPADAKTRLDTQATWGAGIELASGGTAAQQQWFETSLFDADTYVVMVKAVDATQWRSDIPAYVLVNIGAPPISNAVQSINAKNPPANNWPGAYDNCSVVGGVLRQTDSTLDSYFTWNFDNNNFESALLFSTTAEATYSHSLVALTGEDLEINQEENFNLLQENGDKLFAEQRYYSPTELAEGGVVHPYAPFEKLLGDVYRVVTRFKSLDGTTAGAISELTAQLDYADVIEKQNDVSISAFGTVVQLNKTFRAIGSVSITALQTSGGSSAVGAVVTAKTTSSVTIKCLNSSGVGTAGLVDITVIGY